MGLVDSGIMTFGQALGIILGANIGTTITGQIMAFRLEAFGLPLTFMGLILIISGKRMRMIGFNLWGLGFIFLGMDIMGRAFSFVMGNPLVKFALLTTRSHLLAIIFGIIFTAIIQSSSAMTGIVLVLAKNGHLDLITSTAIILGSNVEPVLRQF